MWKQLSMILQLSSKLWYINKSTFTKLNDKNLEASLEDSDIIAKWESLILLVK